MDTEASEVVAEETSTQYSLERLFLLRPWSAALGSEPTHGSSNTAPQTFPCSLVLLA